MAARRPRRRSAICRSCRANACRIADRRWTSSISTRRSPAAPALLLVDELAHTNAPGSRHAKRWEDVAELLEAGIDVWATLNVQHLESLNDDVARITGIRPSETLPDRVLEMADEIELIDVPPADLRHRLRAGQDLSRRHGQAGAGGFLHAKAIWRRCARSRCGEPRRMSMATCETGCAGAASPGLGPPTTACWRWSGRTRRRRR